MELAGLKSLLTSRKLLNPKGPIDCWIVDLALNSQLVSKVLTLVLQFFDLGGIHWLPNGTLRAQRLLNERKNWLTTKKLLKTRYSVKYLINCWKVHHLLKAWFTAEELIDWERVVWLWNWWKRPNKDGLKVYFWWIKSQEEVILRHHISCKITSPYK